MNSNGDCNKKKKKEKTTLPSKHQLTLLRNQSQTEVQMNHFVFVELHAHSCHRPYPEVPSPDWIRSDKSTAHLAANVARYMIRKYRFLSHCHSQYYGTQQLWTHYEQFHGWAPPASRLYVSETDLALSVLPHVCLLAYVWISSFTLTYVDIPCCLMRGWERHTINVFCHVFQCIYL